MSLIAAAAGRYTNTWNSVSTGITEDGYKINNQFAHEMIAESDAYGASPIEGIYRGGECTVDFLGLEQNAGDIAAFWPWGGGTPGVMATAAAPIGMLAGDLAKAFVITVVAGTPAAANSAFAPTSLTSSHAILKENFPATLLFNSKLRKVPISLRFYPYTGSPSTTILWFSTT